MLFLTVPVAMYYVIIRPYLEKKMNILMFINELVLIVNSIGFFFFRSEGESETKTIVAYILIGAILFNYLMMVGLIWTI